MGREVALEALILELEYLRKDKEYKFQVKLYDEIIDYVKSKLDDGYRDNYGIAMESSYNGDKSCVAFGTKDSNDVIKVRAFFMNEQPESMKKSDTSEAMKRVVDTLDSKCNQYRRDPIDVISTNELITQLKIKVIRAQLTSDKAKQEDELLDVAVYAILTLDKLLKK